MTDLFQNVLTASFHGSIVILAVILLRFLLRKTPKKFLCLLWLLAGIRLLMPFEIQSGLSLQPDVDTVVEAQFTPAATVAHDVATPAEIPSGEAVMEEQVQYVYAPAEPEAAVEEAADEELLVEEMVLPPDPLAKLDEIAAYIWVVVAFCFLLYTFASYLRLKFMVREAIRIRGNIWECDRIETAFILGFIRPQIYLPMGMSKNNRRHILAHERTHLEKGDHWIKMIGFIALSIHWFNPLVWLAYYLLCKDIEMACDERVVQFMELEERKSYSAALLNCSTNHAHFAACPVAFGEVSVKNRVMSVLNYKKPSFWISLAGVIAIIFVAVCLVTSPVDKTEPEAALAETTEPTEPREVITVSTVDELLDAIGPDREIVLEAGTYNLSEAATYGTGSDSKYYRWGEVYDGNELILKDVENLTIRGSGMHVTLVETAPRYADVIAMESCANVELADLTAGHTRERGECGGDVISLTESTGVTMTRLGLYGCGVVGLWTEGCSDITLTDSDIYECSSSAANIGTSSGVTLSGCRLYSIGSDAYGGYTYFEVDNSQDVTVQDCELSDSSLSRLFCAYNSELVVKNNRISDNRITGAAMSIQSNTVSGTVSSDVTLSGNKFEDNSIRIWYDLSNVYAHDEKGNDLTETKLQDLYGTEITEPQEPQIEIHVSTVDEFIAAIGSNKKIVLDSELYDLSTATGYGTSGGDYYYWEDIYDGPGLIIQNVTNLTICSASGNRDDCTIAAIPRYADVLTFRSCSYITVSGITAGHTKEQGSCAGGVLEFRDCDVITVDDCGLFGCGILGVQCDGGSNVTVKNTEIYECSQGGIRMWKTVGVNIKNTTFRDIGGSNILMFNDCKDVKRDGEQLIDENVFGYAEIQTPEQEKLSALRNTLAHFQTAYEQGDAEELGFWLSDSYSGDGKPWEGPEENIQVNTTIDELSTDHVRKIEETGSATFTSRILWWDAEKGEMVELGTLTYTVILEKGEYLISDYSLNKA